MRALVPVTVALGCGSLVALVVSQLLSLALSNTLGTALP